MAKPALTQLSEHVYALLGAVNCALIISGNEAIIVDTGLDKDAGRALKKACETLEVTPRYIINTHAHADHYGGNAFLLRHFPEVTIYAPVFEASIMQHPYFEPVYLYSGAKPPKELMSKWLLAPSSPVNQELTAGEKTLLGISLTIHNFPGHAHEQLGVQVGGILLAADALFGEAVLEKYPLPFGQDIAQQRQSMAAIAALDAEVLLPGHDGSPCLGKAAIAALITNNQRVMARASDAVYAACLGSPISTVLQHVCHTLSITLNDLPRYFLAQCVVMAHLSDLKAQEKVRSQLVANELLWYQEKS